MEGNVLSIFSIYWPFLLCSFSPCHRKYVTTIYGCRLRTIRQLRCLYHCHTNRLLWHLKWGNNSLWLHSQSGQSPLVTKSVWGCDLSDYQFIFILGRFTFNSTNQTRAEFPHLPDRHPFHPKLTIHLGLY